SVISHLSYISLPFALIRVHLRLSWILIALLSLNSAAVPQSPSAAGSYEQALSLIQKHQLEPGIALLRKILEQSPNDIKAQNLMGIALTSSGKTEEANVHFQKAIEQNPRFYPALKNLALNELKLKRVDEAKVHLDQLLQFDAKDPVVHLALGEIQFAGKQFGKAVTHYDQSGN